MTREQYIQIKATQPAGVIYQFYKEHLNINKHKLLSYQEFFTFVQMWASLDALFEKVCRYYDNKFCITKLLDKEGNIIKYL